MRRYFSFLVLYASDITFIDNLLSRAKPYSAVSQSVSVLDLSGKDKSAKPPRRLSIPTKTATGPRPAPIGSVTPTSQTRNVRSDGQEKSDTPASDVSRSASRRKFSTLSSVSYWLTQIKLAEASSKHSVSLGFFKLALESGCEVCINYFSTYVFFVCVSVSSYILILCDFSLTLFSFC